MWIAIVFLVVGFLVITAAMQKRQNAGQPTHPEPVSRSQQKNVSSVLDPKGCQATDIESVIQSGNWDWARVALQKMAYSMVGDGVTQAEKDSFKSLMTMFAERDPLYRDIMNLLLPVIKQNKGILQSKIYDFAPQYDQETIRYVLYFAHELGDIYRQKQGRSYKLLPGGELIEG